MPLNNHIPPPRGTLIPIRHQVMILIQIYTGNFRLKIKQNTCKIKKGLKTGPFKCHYINLCTILTQYSLYATV